MKNIHILPTDKPSRLYRNLLTDKLFILENSFMDVSECNREYQNIYITSNEKIKQGDWFYYKHFGEDIIDKTNKNTDLVNLNNPDKYFRKIILTDDPDLIVDGVQAISDTFLEWFVKNPSCEEADVNDWLDDNGNIPFGGNIRYQISCSTYNKIIIPREEPKHEYYCKACGISQDEPFSKCHESHKHCSCEIRLTEEPKQETLEEAAKRLAKGEGYDTILGVGHIWIEGFEKGAQWQQEQDKNKYSEEEVVELLEYVRENFYDTGSKWHSEPDTDLTSKELLEHFKKSK